MTLIPSCQIQWIWTASIFLSSDITMRTFPLSAYLPAMPDYFRCLSKQCQSDRLHSFFRLVLSLISSLHYCLSRRMSIVWDNQPLYGDDIFSFSKSHYLSLYSCRAQLFHGKPYLVLQSSSDGYCACIIIQCIIGLCFETFKNIMITFVNNRIAILHFRIDNHNFWRS